MGEVPPNWRRRLGGPALTGNCCIPIISRTSFGPAAFAFDPARLGGAPSVAGRPLVYYPQEHPTLGAWDATWNPAAGILFNGGTTIRGSSSRGARAACSSSAPRAPARSVTARAPATAASPAARPPTEHLVLRPGRLEQGNPCVSVRGGGVGVRPARLRAVRRGRTRPWQVKPYATWRLRLPFGSGQIGGAAYNSAAGLIYVSQQYGDGTDPVIHVFKVRARG